MKETLTDRIERRIREWPQWSVAERRKMDDVVEDILRYVRSGKGGAFCRW